MEATHVPSKAFVFTSDILSVCVCVRVWKAEEARGNCE
jgi:hypothetical protein